MVNARNIFCFLGSFAALAVFLTVQSSPAFADGKRQTALPKNKLNTPITKITSALSIFSNKLNPRSGMFDVVHVENEEAKQEFVAPEPPKKTKQELLEEQLEYYSSDPKTQPIPKPHERASVRVSPDAPAPIRGMLGAKRMGDMALAEQYADQFVRLQKDYFFEVREMSNMIGEALVRQKVISTEDWRGAEQMMVREMATTRKEMNAILKPDHDTAMKRITPDSKGKAQVFYFFSLSCSWCRHMGPDVERLWRIAEKDPNISMNVLAIGDIPKNWLVEYQSYTGMSMPIQNGTELAKKFNLGFVPALVVIAPSENRAYMKTGQQSFLRMYQFVKTVQGIPAEATPALQQLVNTPIGEQELANAKAKGLVIKANKKGARVRKARRMELGVF